MEDFEKLRAELLKEGSGLWDFDRNSKKSRVWWTSIIGQYGTMYFSFDKKTIFPLWGGLSELTPEQKEIFRQDEPFWWEFFNIDTEE